METQVAGARECVSLKYFMSDLRRSFFVVFIEGGRSGENSLQSSHEPAKRHCLSSVRSTGEYMRNYSHAYYHDMIVLMLYALPVVSVGSVH